MPAVTEVIYAESRFIDQSKRRDENMKRRGGQTSLSFLLLSCCFPSVSTLIRVSPENLLWTTENTFCGAAETPGDEAKAARPEAEKCLTEETRRSSVYRHVDLQQSVCLCYIQYIISVRTSSRQKDSFKLIQSGFLSSMSQTIKGWCNMKNHVALQRSSPSVW